MQKRDTFGSRLGFLLVSAGCAIGIGNVWKFPWMAGQYGGGIFVVFYLLFLAIMGIPVLSAELAVGRAGRKSAVGAYRALEKPGSKWHIHGWFCVAGCYLLMMYYTTVSGWMLNYAVKFATGTFAGMATAEETAGVFGGMLASPVEMMAYMAVTVLLGFLVCSTGVQKGLERITKWMMLALLVLIVILAAHSCTLAGGGEGLRYYLLPSLQRAKEAGGLVKVMVGAMNQAFFTLSLGIGAMEIFGSYMADECTLPGESLRICLLDTFVALMAGFIIFPACTSYGVEVNAGPALIFMTLPNVFIHMAGGRLWGTLFFVFMTFASFSTVIAVFENLIASCIDNFGWERKKAVVINCVFILVASIPCVLGYNVLSGFHPMPGKDVLDTEDFIVSNLLLPGGSIVFILFCVLRSGWGMDKFLAECNKGKGLKLSAELAPYLIFVLPVLIAIILIAGLLPS